MNKLIVLSPQPDAFMLGGPLMQKYFAFELTQMFP